MKKALKISCTFVGTVIGAGFATGKEISLFFASCNPLTLVLSGVFFGLFSFIILQLSAIFGNVFKSFGYLEKVIKAFVLLANFCVLCATVAGSESCLSSLLSIRGGAILTTFLCLVVVLFGMKYIKYSNLFIVPIIVILVLIIFFSDSSFSLQGRFSIVSPFSYASMNLITGGFLIGMDSDKPTKKECLLSSVLSAVIMTILLFCIHQSIRTVSGAMPFMEKADALGLGIVGHCILYLAMITTIIGTLSVCSGNNKKVAFFVACGALLSSTFGFEKIVSIFYPILGAIGGAIILFASFIYLYKSKKIA